jgi:hypothetical protein
VSDVYTLQAGPASQFQNTVTNATEQHLFFVGASGQLIHSWWDGIAEQGGQPQWGTEARTTSVPPGSDPVVMQLQIEPPTGRYELHVHFRGSDSSLQHLWYDGSSWLPTNSSETIPGTSVSAPPQDPWGHDSGRALGGTNYAIRHNGADTHLIQQHIFYYGTDGALHDRYFDGTGWQMQPALPGPIAGPPTAQTLNYPSPQLNVFYTGTDGSLHQTWSGDGINWNTRSVAGKPLGPPAAAPCAINLNCTTTDQAVWYRGASQTQPSDNFELWRTYYDGTQFVTENLAAPPGLAIDPLSYADQLMTRREHALYMALGGSIYEIWLGLWDGSSGSDQPPGTAARVLGIGQFEDATHIFYAAGPDSNGNYFLQQTSGGNGDWKGPVTIPAASPPTIYPVSGGGGGPGGCNLPAALIGRLRRNQARSGKQGCSCRLHRHQGQGERR